MQRFYFENLESTDDSVTIKNPELLNQLIKVLRIKKGDEFAFFNSKEEIDYIFKVISIDKREIYTEKVGFIQRESEIDFDLNIISALPNKLEKIEYIIQKGTEVGVTNFMFFKSERSQKLNLSENKIIRLNNIIKESVEQSGRSFIPELVITDDIALEDFAENENILFHTQDQNSISLKDTELDYDKGINLFVGPEGGFSEEEINAFVSAGFKKVHLGNRILRTETTPVVTGFYLIQNR